MTGLANAISKLGFARLLGTSRPTKTRLARASVRVIQALMNGDHRAKGVSPRAISRYAAALLSSQVGRFELGRTPV
eukprot:3451606-Pleurochrysis_carterae.AAC.1